MAWIASLFIGGFTSPLTTLLGAASALAVYFNGQSGAWHWIGVGATFLLGYIAKDSNKSNASTPVAARRVDPEPFVTQ